MSCNVVKNVWRREIFFMSHFSELTKSMSYYNGMYPHLIDTELNVKLLWIKLLTCDQFLIIFNFW